MKPIALKKKNLKKKKRRSNTPFVLCTQSILQLFLEYPSWESFFDLLLAATPRRGERHLASFLPFLILTCRSGMQLTSERFQMYHFQTGLHVTAHTRGSRWCSQSLRTTARGASHASDPPVLHLLARPWLQQGRNSVRITSIHLASTQAGPETDQFKHWRPAGAAERQFRLRCAGVAAARHAPGTSLCNRNREIPPPLKSSHRVTRGKANPFSLGWFPAR